MPKIIQLQRVIYGRKDTPVEDREFVPINQNRPVGTIKEWKSQGYEPEIITNGK